MTTTTTAIFLRCMRATVRLCHPKFTLPQSLKQDKPTLLFFYVDDSQDSKEFSPTVSQLQAPYGREANFVAVAADSVPVKDSL